MRTLAIIFFIVFGIDIVVSQSSTELYKQSQELMNKGDYNEALISINRALVIDSTESDYYLQKAVLYFKMAKYDQSVRYCYSALKNEPEKLDVFLLRGQICLVTESYGGSIFFFDKVVKQTNDINLLYYAYLNRAKVYHALGKEKEENNDLRTLKKLCPDSVQATYLLAQNFQALSSLDSAYIFYDEVIQKRPSYSDAYKKIAEVECSRKNYTNAVDILKKYQVLRTDDKSVSAILSTIYLESNDYDNAIKVIKQAIVADPKEPVNYKILGTIYLKQERKEEGCNSLFKAFQMGYLEKYGYEVLDIYMSNCEH
jgi:tetratricopeptide (TPR) repeat protein